MLASFMLRCCFVSGLLDVRAYFGTKFVHISEDWAFIYHVFLGSIFKHVGEGWVHANFRDYAEKRCAEPVLYAIFFSMFLHRIFLGFEVFILQISLPRTLPWLRLAFAVLFLNTLTNYVQLIHELPSTGWWGRVQA